MQAKDNEKAASLEAAFKQLASAFPLLLGANIVDSNFARTPIFLGIEGYLLPIVQTLNSRPLESGCVNEHVLSAIIRLDKAEAFLMVIEFYSTCLHDWSL